MLCLEQPKLKPVFTQLVHDLLNEASKGNNVAQKDLRFVLRTMQICREKGLLDSPKRNVSG
jgi:hypothetical protein